MIEIIKIFLFFLIFTIFIIAPVNIFDENNQKIKIKIINLNLILNFNFLLFFSLLDFQIKNYQLFYIIILFLFFFFSLIYTKINLFFLFKKYITKILILYFSFFILAVNIAVNLNLGWDAKYFYFIKSLFFFEGLSFNNLTNFEPNKWHPHLGSYVWAFFWSLPLFELEYFGRLSYIYIFCFSIYYITRNTNELYIASFLYFTLLVLLFKYERFSGLQEILIFSFLTISSKILYQLNFKKNLIDLVSIVLIANLFLWIKAEGAIYGLIIILISLFNKNILFYEKITIFFSFIILIIFKYYIYYLNNFEINAQPYHFDYLLNLNLQDYLYRLIKIILYLGYYSFKNPIFLTGVIFTVLIAFLKIEKIKIKNFILYLILNTTFIFTAYLFRDLEIIYSLRTTLERIVFTSSGFYVYLIVLLIYKKWKKF